MKPLIRILVYLFLSTMLTSCFALEQSYSKLAAPGLSEVQSDDADDSDVAKPTMSLLPDETYSREEDEVVAPFVPLPKEEVANSFVPPPEDTVCDPLKASTSNLSDEYGLKGQLTDYRELVAAPGFDIWSLTLEKIDANASSYADVFLFFSDVNVAPRSWTAGFLNRDGATLGSDGEAVVEFFRLKLQSDFQLVPEEGDVDGVYEFSMISDDGARVKLNGAVLTSDDSVHAPRWSQPGEATLVAGQKYPMEVDYFQGPRVQIALQLHMRLKGTAAWKTISPKHFLIPNGGVNPCAVAAL